MNWQMIFSGTRYVRMRQGALRIENAKTRDRAVTKPIHRQRIASLLPITGKFSLLFHPQSLDGVHRCGAARRHETCGHRRSREYRRHCDQRLCIP
jgi:hypothetical protein